MMTPAMLMAQKRVKYKDIFPQLNAKNYEAAEADLRIFLADDKNDDHANAHFQLGAILEDEFYKMDLLSDTTLFIQKADSAITFFQKAIQFIDEKELKRNDEYYLSFHRRDLRTGEFGIKLSDVHLDIEKKIEALEERTVAIRKLHAMLLRVKGRNNLSASIYRQLVDRTEDYTQLLFSMTDDDLVNLQKLQDNAAGIYELSNEIQQSAKALGSDYFQGFQQFNFIEQYGVDGLEQVNVFEGQLSFWDYETWAKAASDDYENVKQYKSDLKALLSNLQSAEGQLAQDMVPGTTSTLGLTENYQRYDANGPMKPWIELNDAMIRLKALHNANITPSMADTASVFLKNKSTERALAILDEADSLYARIEGAEAMELAVQRYTDILESHYEGAAAYTVAVQNAADFLKKERIFWAALADEISVRNR
jgi:hypothetical protein